MRVERGGGGSGVKRSDTLEALRGKGNSKTKVND